MAKSRIIYFVIFIIFLGFFGYVFFTRNETDTPNPQPNPQPVPQGAIDYRGIYVASKWDKSVPEDVFLNENVDGIFYRLTWDSIQTGENSFNWSFLQSEIEKIKKANTSRQNKLQISIGITAGTYTPQFVYDLGVQKLSFHETHGSTGKDFDPVSPVVWDPIYINAYLKLMQSLKDTLTASGAYNFLSIIKFAPFARDTVEVRLPAENNADSNATAIWTSAGYTPEKIKNAWFEILDKTIAIFPDKYMSMAIIPQKAFPQVGNGEDMTLQLMRETQNKIPDKFIVQWNALSGTVGSKNKSYILQAYENGSIVGFQLNQQAFTNLDCANACDENMLKSALEKGISLHAGFVEIFEQDVSYFPNAVKYGHDYLTK